MTVEPDHVELLRHMLGLTRSTVEPCRNHFLTGPDADDLPTLEAMEGLGLVERTRTPGFVPQDSINFRATDLGRAAAVTAARREEAAIPRSAKRYRRWLDLSDAFGDWSFGDWLKAGCPGL